MDVANLAGVSRTTVSLVLNNIQWAKISPETRRKVFQAVEELGYVPNAAAQALAGHRTQAIGLVFTRNPQHISSDAFLPRVVTGLLDVIRANNLRLLIDIVEPEHQERAYLELVRNKRIDGIVFSGPRLDDTALETLEKEKFPTVLMGRLPNSNFCSVDVDNRSAARQAVEYLISLGHRQIACLAHAHTSYTASLDRLAGYQEALSAAGIPYDENLVRFSDFEPRSGYEQMKLLLDARIPFTAAFVTSDTVAIGARAAIREYQLKIPDDISLIGFDDVAWACYFDPALTTTRLPAEEIGRQACLMLLNILSGQLQPCEHVLLETELIRRDSCRKL